MKLTQEQQARIETIIKQWHEARRAEFEASYSNLKYDSPAYSKTYQVGAKYVHLLDGRTGAFMVDLDTGLIYEMKGYGVPNKQKIAGNAWDPTFDGAQLHKCRYVRGRYDNR